MMDHLELNIRQVILSDIVLSVRKTQVDWFQVRKIIARKVYITQGDKKMEVLSEKGQKTEKEADLIGRRLFMPASTVHFNIAVGELAVNISDACIRDVYDDFMEALFHILDDLPYIDFDKCLSWQDWALPDQLVFFTISALLRLSGSDPRYAEEVTIKICKFLSKTVVMIKNNEALVVLTQLCPALHGFYRAISSYSFPWKKSQWKALCAQLDDLCSSLVVDRLNHLLLDIFHVQNIDEPTQCFAQTFISRYVAQERPLTGYFLVCCITETQWTILAQVLVPPTTISPGEAVEAAAANQAWLSLMSRVPLVFDVEDIEDDLNRTLKSSMQCFNDLLSQIEEMDTDPSLDTYAWETMSESLKLASVCSVSLRQLDEELFSCLLLLLSDKSPVTDNLVQEAALKASTVLVQCFRNIAPTMVTHLRRFFTSPLPIFEFEFALESRAPPPLAAAAKCLALCIRLAPGEDLILSNMYSLLNYIAATSKEIDRRTSVSTFDYSPFYSSQESAISLVEARLGLSDDEQRLVGITNISVVTRLALEFRAEEVTRLTISMLLQRLRTAEPTFEAAIAYNLVDLALFAPESAFADIIHAFSMINRSANPEDPRFSNNMVLAAQTRLAQELHRRPDLYELYFVELLSLFADKGVAIQNLKSENHYVKIDDNIEQLSSLLLPIDSLLSHEDFNPQIGPSTTLISLFRNMWFLCVLFELTSIGHKDTTAMDWLQPALSRIASKTPSLVVEHCRDSVTSDIEYSSVIRQEYANTVNTKHRATLLQRVPTNAGETRSLSCGHIIFVIMMHDLESLRSAIGLTSSLAAYFMNESINSNVGLSACMTLVAEQVIRSCINNLNLQVCQQHLPNSLYSELRILLIYSTHRIEKARNIALNYLDCLITSFPSLMCDRDFVFAVLEILTLLQHSCENEFTDEYSPHFEYRSEKTGITLQLSDNYQMRYEVLSILQRSTNDWFELALRRAPIELQTTLQQYLSVHIPGSHSSELGASLAEEFGKRVTPVRQHLSFFDNRLKWKADGARNLAAQIAIKSYFSGQAKGIRCTPERNLQNAEQYILEETANQEANFLRRRMSITLKEVRNKSSRLTLQDLNQLLFRCAAMLLALGKCDYDILHYIVLLPLEVGTPAAVATSIDVWNWLIAEMPDIEVALITEILYAWIDAIRHRRGLFSNYNNDDPFYHPIEFSPTVKDVIHRELSVTLRYLTPHMLVLRMLLNRLQAARYRSPETIFIIQTLILRSTRSHFLLSTHALAREIRFFFLLFGFETLKSSHLDLYSESLLRDGLYLTAFSWFAVRPRWSYGANRVQIDADVKALAEFLSYLQNDNIRGSHEVSSSLLTQVTSRDAYYCSRLRDFNQPLRLLIESEILRLNVWGNPTNDIKRGTDHIPSAFSTMPESSWAYVARIVWKIKPAIAVHLPERFSSTSLRNEVTKLARSNPLYVVEVASALSFFLDGRFDRNQGIDLMHLLLWAPVSPVLAISLFEPRYQKDPLILQYAHRVLKQHQVDLAFFFVPQIVQALRYDSHGYIAHFIQGAAKISQLFCHQIIWNMRANCYKDDLAEVEDPLKPSLDLIIQRVLSSLSGESKDFYDREFSFFNQVTSISGKLKPFVKKSKAEKKAKIDEEMTKVDVDVGVYLPSNPDGKVVDIDKKSGRPLQSHAKAPFMASFKVRKERIVVSVDPEFILAEDEKETRSEYEVWQQAIFKVGDDCRQDVLALQMIAMFKNIFTSVGLVLYLFPYRVVATGPGCGVIDVVPNATSRDEMGRAKVNDLLDFFITRYGRQDSVTFQKARLNFIQSMAAYSVACYILQIKDRHNGNIMIDGDGHIVHIDFGFLFDIGPGGVRFEPSSFKLNHEMVILMGGRHSQGYQLFQNLTVKAFLAIRPHADQLTRTVQLMLDTNLPSFKGESTIKRLRDRFALNLSDRQAADHMMAIIRNAHENVRSTAYDEFQRLQNGIPYR